MSDHSESRPSYEHLPRRSGTSFHSAPRWTPYPVADGASAVPSAANDSGTRAKPRADELSSSLDDLEGRLDGEGSKEAIVETVRKFARAMQRKIATLGREPEPKADRAAPATSVDGYDPSHDVVAPISVRPNAMELLWVCGDCGEHYPRARECPESCRACGAPKEHFYAPIED
jgi:hypothetical protein